MLMYLALVCFVPEAGKNKEIRFPHLFLSQYDDQSYQFIETFILWKSYAVYMREIKASQI